jgi:hypothetical protein
MPARILQTTFVTKQDALLAGIDTRQISAADKVRALDSALARYSQDMPRLTAIDFAGSSDRYYVLSGLIVNIADTDQDASIDLKSTGADSQLGVAFTLPRPMTVQAIRLLLKRIGAPAGSLACQIRLPNGTLPSTLAVATSNSLDNDVDLPLGFEAGKTEFTFATPITLAAGTYYAVLVPSGYTYGSGTLEIDLGVDQSSVTNTLYTFDGTSTWTAYGTASAGIIEVIAALSRWDAEWSDIKGADIPAPVITLNGDPQTLEQEDFSLYRVGETQYLYLPNNAPTSSDTIRLNYSSRYTFIGSPLGTDIPAAHFEAVCSLSAYFVCTWLATKYGQNVDGGLNADMIDRRNQSDVYASRAAEFLKQYEALLGLGEEAATSPAAEFADLDRATYSRREFIYHDRRVR